VKLILLISLFLTVGCLKTRSDIKIVEQNRGNQEQINDMRKENADRTQRFSEIQDEMRSLNGRIDVLENRVNILSQEKESKAKAEGDDQQELARKLEILQEALAKIEGQLSQVATQQEAAKVTPVSKDSFEAAENLFEEKEWKKAIVAYTKFRDGNPKSKQYSMATLKIAICFEQLDMKDEALTFYEEVVAKSPKSEEAKKAKARIKALKK
jgi:TolA-binding protein